MKLFVMRHGQAEDRAPTDAERPLSASGREQAISTGTQLASLLDSEGLRLSGILCSPYLRAQQTTEQVRSQLVNAPEPVLSSLITPDEDPVTAVNRLPDEGCWLLVAHMPMVSRLTSLLTEGTSTGGLPYQTAMVVELDMSVSGAGLATLGRILNP